MLVRCLSEPSPFPSNVAQGKKNIEMQTSSLTLRILSTMFRAQDFLYYLYRGAYHNSYRDSMFHRHQLQYQTSGMEMVLLITLAKNPCLNGMFHWKGPLVSKQTTML